jgi:hypothetical protein
MTMTEEMIERGRRRDRLINWILVGLLVVALLGGWALKASAEGRTTAFIRDTLQVRYPTGWLQAKTQLPVLFQAEDRGASPVATTLAVERQPLAVGMENPLAVVQQNMAFDRAGLNSYRVLEVQTDFAIGGRTGMHVTFAYVDNNPNPFLQTLPVVIQGEDYLFLEGDFAYVFTLTAAQENYAQVRHLLDDLVRSWR